MLTNNIRLELLSVTIRPHGREGPAELGEGVLLGKIREEVAICELKEGMALEEFVAGASESDISLARPLLSLLTAESSLVAISLVITYQHHFGSSSVPFVYVQDLGSIWTRRSWSQIGDELFDVELHGFSIRGDFFDVDAFRL